MHKCFELANIYYTIQKFMNLMYYTEKYTLSNSYHTLKNLYTNIGTNIYLIKHEKLDKKKREIA